jgi:hypothetical protein
MCDSTPVRLLFATSDPGIYNNGYKWDGQMYVSVTCGGDAAYLSLDASPFTWNFCNSDCRLEDRILTVLFTFKPDSVDSNEYLKFELDSRGYIISRPSNIIKDNSGKDVDLDIESVSRYGQTSGPESLMEVWLARGAARGIFIPHLESDTKGIVNWSKLIKTLVTGVAISAAIIGLIYLIEKTTKKRGNNLAQGSAKVNRFK